MVFFSILIISLFLLAQDPEESLFPMTQFTLDNGLQVILSEDYSLPLVSVVISYNVGSIHEKEGKAGLAYLLENLMFQGSKNVGQMQHISYIQRSGGNLNAVTTADKTTFYQTVPSNQLALVLWLESDRMEFLNIDSTKVENAKAGLIQELHNRKIADPYLESTFLFDAMLYHNYAYGHPVLGKEEDIREITVDDVKSFYKTYYTPNNAVLSIAGNIDMKKARQLIQKYFSSIPRGRKPPDVVLGNPPEIRGVTQAIKSPFAPSPAFHIGFQIAHPYTKDYYSLGLIEYILLRGQSSRLHKRLIKKDRTALYLRGGIEKKNDRAVFKIFVIANNEIMKELSQKAVLSEINKLRSGFIYEKEIQKSKNMFERDYINQYASFLDRAIFLAETMLNRKNLDELPNELDHYLSVTRAEIIQSINKYFVPNNIVINIETE